jgi:hypothetical protein
VPGTSVGRSRGRVTESVGAYAGVHLGDSKAVLVKALGEPLLKQGPDIVDSENSPQFLPADAPDAVYRDLEATFIHGKVASMTIYGQGARTTGGVKIGDPLASVKPAYESARCRPTGRGGEREISPECDLMVGPHTYLYFGDDPIKLIVLSSKPFAE